MSSFEVILLAQRLNYPIWSDGTEGWDDVSEEDKIAMNYYEKHQVKMHKNQRWVTSLKTRKCHQDHYGLSKRWLNEFLSGAGREQMETRWTILGDLGWSCLW